MDESIKSFISIDKEQTTRRGKDSNDWCLKDSKKNSDKIVEIKITATELENKEEKVESLSDVPEINIENTEEELIKSSEYESDVEWCFFQPLSAIEELANSDYVHNRQLAARRILDSLQQAESNEKELQMVISIMCKLSEDDEVNVQYELMQHIPAIASYCQTKSNLRIVIRQQLMPYTVKLLNNVQVMIRRSGQSALLVLLEKNLIDQSQLMEWICPLVSQLVMCESNLEELRIEDVSLMSKMIPLVGRETTVKFFLEPYISLCCDSAFGIRKVCALGFGALCKTVGLETTELSLLPTFLNLCCDDMWGVRVACTDVFVDVASSVNDKTKREVLPHIFVNLMTDNSTYVKSGAYRNLGAFIYTFADSNKTRCSYVNGKITAMNENCSEPSIKKTNSQDYTFSITDNFHASQGISSYKNLIKCSSCDSTGKYLGSQSDHGDPDYLTLCHRKSNSLHNIASKEGHVYLHLDSANSFNNFQFWRVPLSEVNLDIDIEEGKTTILPMRASVPGNESSATSEIKVRIASSRHYNSNTSSAEFPGIDKMLEQTSFVNTLTSLEHQSLLDDEVEVLQSFKESILTFREDEPECEVTESSCISASSFEKSDILSKLKNDVEDKKLFENTRLENQDIVPPILLSSLISAVNNSSFQMRNTFDDEKLSYIAYSFPAVVLTLGRKNWPCIRKTYSKLAHYWKWTVRRTIASSMHELATILGYDIIVADLLPVYLDLFKDVDEVRLQLVQHLSDFLKHLCPEDRKQFLPLIEEFTKVDNDKNWRFRCTVAWQLKSTSELYDVVEVREYFLPVASTLLHDRVSAVRLEAVKLVAILLKKIYHDQKAEAFYLKILDDIDNFYRQAQKWIWRQTYILLCEQIVLNESMCVTDFVEYIIPKMLTLAWDKVANVRLVLVRCLASTFISIDLLPVIALSSCHQLLLQALDTLSFDSDKDVRHLAQMSSFSSWKKIL